MAKNDWYEAGDQIKKLVQDAIDSKDFSQLSNTISNVVNQTVDGLQSAIKENIGDTAQWRQEHTNTTARQRWYERTNTEAADRIKQNIRTRQRSHTEEIRPPKPVKVKLKVPGEISGRIMKWFGYSIGSMLGLSLGILGIVAVAEGVSILVPGGILALLCGTTLSIGIGGSRRLGLARRFRRYKEILGERTYCLIEELASAVGQNYKFVRKDLKRMIRKGYFTEGHLDRGETLLMTDRDTYQQYLLAQTEYAHREAVGAKQETVQAEASQTKEKPGTETPDRASKDSLSPECRELIEEGRGYIQHIHECNEKIPDETMSAKLDRLELVITRIFREAEKDPSVASDLKKMMSYYLPTTRKLLDAYCDMDSQPIRGQNIESTKKEIEDALDTINAAFENLLDSFFEEKAWDISSDISVLHTMLAQEGLTGKDFVKS